VQYGIVEQRRGERTFFLYPGEEIIGGIQKMIVLQEDEAVLLKANENYEDKERKVKHTAG
jgi:major vault protein